MSTCIILLCGILYCIVSVQYMFLCSTEQVHYKDRLASHLVSEEAEWNLIRTVFGGEMAAAATSGSIQPEDKETVRKLKERARRDLLKVRIFFKRCYFESM